MFGATEKRGGYKPLDGNLEEQTPLNDEHNEPVLILRRRYNSAGLILSCLSTATIMIVIVVVLRTLSHPEPPKPSTCRGASLRREWRSLSMSEKHQYIDAVNCLRDQPSAIGLNQSLYDDFPYIHSRVGQYSHDSAAFIAWHRYFIHIYERQLREKCSYRGSLTYWDWSLDWEDFSKSPVWSNEHGFGGSGDPDVGETLLDGYCVTTGPFAHLSVIFIKHDYHPHCLSRGFVRDKDELAVHRAMYHPLTIDEIVSSDNYSHFNLNLEHGPHDGIPRSVRGDFSMLTAPAGKYHIHTRPGGANVGC